MELLALLFALLLSSNGVIASVTLTPSQICLKACYNAVASLKFSSSPPPPPKSKGTPPSKFLCSSFLPISSTYACYRTYCHFPADKAAFLQQNITCGKRMPSYGSIMEKVDLHNLTVANISNPALVYNTTVLPPQKKVAFLVKSLTTTLHMRHLNHVYSWSLYTIVACLAAVTVIFRILGAINSHGCNWTVFNMIKKHVLLPAAFGQKHAEYSTLGKVPTRLESLLIFSYVAVNVILCCISYPQHLGQDPGHIQNWDRLSDRASALAVGNLPIMFLFAGRNNLLLWITGVPYSTFNLFHRWTARVLTVQAFVHATSHMVLWVDAGGWPMVWKAWKTQQYVYCGAIAFFSFLALNLTGNYQMRKRLYDVFLIIHVPLALIALVTMFYHVKVTHGSHNPYLWPCAGFWIFDRLVRVWRIGYGALFSRSTSATAVYDPDADMIRLFVRSKDLGGRNMLGPAPGQHYFLHTSTGPLGLFENHPFSLMAWDRKGTGKDIEKADSSITTPPAAITPLEEEKKLEANLSEDGSLVKVKTNTQELPSPSSGSTSSSSSINGDTARALGVVMTREDCSPSSTATAPSGLQFMLKPRSGMTGRLKERILSSGSTSIKLRVAIEGPYGHRHNFKHFERVLLLAGGSGITALLPYARQISNSPAAGQNVKLLWSTRSYQKSYSKELLMEVNDATVYVTSAPGQSISLEDMGGVDMRRGRIDVPQAVSEEFTKMEAGKRLAVVCCGPGKMCDDVRKAVIQTVGGKIQVDYFEENFGW